MITAERFEWNMKDVVWHEPRVAARHPESPVHKAADAHLKPLTLAVMYAFLTARKAYKSSGTDAAISALKAALRKALPPVLSKTLAAGGEVAVQGLRTQLRGAELRTLKPPIKKKIGAFNLQFDMGNARAAKWATEHVGWLIDSITKTTREKIQEAVARAQIGGDLDQQYEDILDAIGNEERANVIARTESMTAANAGQREGWDQAVDEGLLTGDEQREWIAMSDACAECEALDGQTAELDGEYPDEGGEGPPLHPNCVIGSTLVAAGGHIAAVSERFFKGEVVVIQTARGHQLRCTPNHPILTDKGWVAAGQLHEGSQVVSSLRRELVLPSNDHDIYMPTSIQKVADAYRISNDVLTNRVVMAAPDFHGDGTVGQVAVVFSNSLLRNSSQTTPFLNSVGDKRFQFRLHATLLACSRRAQQRVQRVLSSAYGIMSVLSERIAFFLRHSFETPLVAVADGCSARVSASDLRGSLFGGHLRPVKPLVFAGSAQSDSSLLEFPNDTAIVAQSASVHDAAKRLAGQVGPDDIVTVERERFFGHVYNLQTEDGWYVAGGMVTHNCRCTEGISAQ